LTGATRSSVSSGALAARTSSRSRWTARRSTP
jgi:hypothetical protein